MLNDNQSINFNNEKDFNNTVDQIMQVTRDNKADWKLREAAIKKIEGIVLGNYGESITFIRLFNQKLYLNISIQMGDLRTSLMKEACRILVLSVKRLRERLEPAVEKVLSPLILFKLIGSSNKVIYDAGSACGMEIIKHIDSAKVVARLAEQAKNKNQSVRLRICQYMLYIVDNYSTQTVNKCITTVEEFILTLTHDASGEVRQTARKVYSRYLAQFPSNGNKLFEQFELNIQKTILEEGSKQTDYTTDKFIELTNEEEIFNKRVLKSPKKDSLSYTTNTNNSISQLSALNSPAKKSGTKSVISTISKPMFQSLEDQIKQYITNSSSEELSSKLQAFESISALFNEIYSNIDFIAKATLKSLINVHISYLGHTYPKLATQVMKNLTKFIFYLDDIFTEEQIDKITKIVTINISSNQEIISQNANALFDIMRKKIDPNLILRPLIEIIDTDIMYEILDISIDIITPLIELSVNTLSDQDYLNIFILKLVKICLIYNKDDTNMIDKIMDVIESIWKKYPRQLSIGVFNLDSEYKGYILDLIDSYLKNISKSVKDELVEIERSRFKTNTDKEKLDSLILALNIKTEINGDGGMNIDKEGIIATALDYNKFLNHILIDENKGVSEFIASLDHVKHDRIASILTTTYMFVLNNTFILKDHIGRFINRLLLLLERFPEHNDTIRKVITMCININKELFLVSINNYLDGQQNQHIIQIILTFVQNTITGCDTDAVLGLLPNFIESVFGTLNHNISDVRKLGVYCIVEIYLKIGPDFDEYLNNLNTSQRNLINIYIQKKRDNYI
jgi:hypothetical protein